MASSDSNNFSSSSPRTYHQTLWLFQNLKLQDRLPTVSASQALRHISSTPRRPIPTGLKSLDAFLQGREHEDSSQTVPPVGIPRGEVTEIYGPPGVGKTTLAYVDRFLCDINCADHALCSNKVKQDCVLTPCSYSECKLLQTLSNRADPLSG